MTEPWRVEVFGETTLHAADGAIIPLTKTQQRLLARLALAAGTPTTMATLIDALWDQEAPSSARAAVQNQVSRIRRVAHPDLISTSEQGYRLHARVDVDDFLAAITTAESAMIAGTPDLALDQLDEVLAQATTDLYSPIAHVAEAQAARARVSAAIEVAENLRVDAALAVGRIGWALLEAQRLTDRSPLDAGRVVLLSRALDLHGRRGDAMATLSAFRQRVRADLGIDAGPAIDREQNRLLNVPARNVATGRRDFLGRTQELAQAMEAVRLGRFTWLHGEPGIGVSRMVEQVRHAAADEGMSTAWSECPVHMGGPGAPLLGLLDDLGVTPDHDRGVVGAFLDAVRTRAAHRHVVLVLDDWHQAGPSTGSAMRAAAKLPNISVVVGTHAAPEPVGDDVVIELGGLDDDTVAEFIRHHGDVGLTVDAAELNRLAAGNPLLLEMLLRSDAGTTLGDGPVLDDFYAALTADLSTGERQLLEAAAVAGSGAPAELVRAFHHGDEPLRWPAGLAEERHGTVHFRHPALQSVAYRHIDAGRRAEIHHALGLAARAAGSAPEFVASHLIEAADLDPTAAYEAGMRAGEDATRSGMHIEAAAWFGRARQAVGDRRPRPLLAAQIAQGDALRLAGRAEHADLLIDAANLAIELGDHEHVARAAYALLQLGATSDVAAPQPRVRAVIDAALASVPSDIAPALQAAASLAWSLSGNAALSRELFVKAEQTAITGEIRRHTLPFAYMALGLPEDLPERERIGRELLGLGRDADDPVASFEAHHLLFSAGLQRGDGRGVRRSLAAMSDLIERIGDVGRRWALLYQRATIAHLQGESTAEALSEDALAMFHEVSPNRAIAAHFAQVFAIRMTEGRTGELAGLLDQLVRDQSGIPAWHAALALSLANTGEPGDRAAAKENIAAALGSAQRDVTWLAAHLVAGRAAAQIGDREHAAALVEVLHPWSGRGCWQGSCSFGSVDTVLAMLHRLLGHEPAVALHRTAAEAFAHAMGAPALLADLVMVLDE